jgi:hypothetical protein
MIAKSPHRALGAAHFAQALALASVFTFGSAATASEAASSSAPAVLPSTPENWSTAAKRDVEAAYRIFVDNHPGMFNQDDPGFQARLREARDRGLKLGARVRDGAGYAAALQAFSAGLRDGHAQVGASLPAGATKQRWPGFVAVWRADRLRVFGSSVSDAPVGATILDCDGRDTRAIVLENVFAYGGRADESGQWWASATNLFRDDGNPFVKLPQRCRFSAGGTVSELALSWRPVDDRYRAWRRAGYNGETLPPGLTEPRPKLFWLALPTFQPDESQRTAYRTAFDELRRRRSEILAADAVVIDLRANQGGSSTWGQEVAETLWGSKPVDAFLNADPSRAWWRASPDNTRYVSSLPDILRGEGQAQRAISEVERPASGMKAALAKGEPYWKDPIAPAQASTASPAEVAPLKTPVYVIVPGQCASACLDALDLFVHFPNTKLIGAPSSADSVYIDVRIESLPGGLAKVVIPNKLYRNRPRTTGQVYTPAIEVNDLQWSTAAFRDVIESDLRAGVPVPRDPS